MDSGGLHVETRGSGSPPIVFTHGFARDGHAWDRQVEALAGDHFVVTWDMRGHGRSPAPAGDYTRELALADLRRVAEVATADGRGPAVLVGHSLGGYLSLAYTLTWPETVAGLVLLSTGPGFRNPDSMVAYNRSIDKVAAAGNIAPNAAEVAVHRDSMVIDRLAEITCPVVQDDNGEARSRTRGTTSAAWPRRRNGYRARIFFIRSAAAAGSPPTPA